MNQDGEFKSGFSQETNNNLTAFSFLVGQNKIPTECSEKYLLMVQKINLQVEYSEIRLQPSWYFRPREVDLLKSFNQDLIFSRNPSFMAFEINSDFE